MTPRPSRLANGLVTVAVAALALLTIAACSDDVPGNADIYDQAPVSVATVSLARGGFDPSSVTIDVGDAVTFANDTSTDQRIVGDDDELDTGTLEPGETTLVVFNEAGTVAFHVRDDDAVTGEIVVRGVTTP